MSEVFIRFFVEAVGHYSLFLTQTEKGERAFQREAFRKSVASKSIRRFLEVFMESQMFAGFIQDRELRKCRAKGKASRAWTGLPSGGSRLSARASRHPLRPDRGCQGRLPHLPGKCLRELGHRLEPCGQGGAWLPPPSPRPSWEKRTRPPLRELWSPGLGSPWSEPSGLCLRLGVCLRSPGPPISVIHQLHSFQGLLHPSRTFLSHLRVPVSSAH